MLTFLNQNRNKTSMVKNLWLGYESLNNFLEQPIDVQDSKEHLGLVITRMPGTKLPGRFKVLDEFFPIIGKMSPKKLKHALITFLAENNLDSKEILVIGSSSDSLIEAFLTLGFPENTEILEESESYLSLGIHPSISMEINIDPKKEVGNTFNIRDLDIMILPSRNKLFKDLNNRGKRIYSFVDYVDSSFFEIKGDSNTSEVLKSFFKDKKSDVPLKISQDDNIVDLKENR